MWNFLFALIATASLTFCPVLFAEVIGSVDTSFSWTGPDDKISVEVFDDPDVKGASCYLSRAVKGGLAGAVGLAEDTSDASIACRQTGPIDLPNNIENGSKDGTQVFKQRTSVIFKTMQVVRFYDLDRHVLVYLVYSDKLVDGSPKNSTSVIAINQNFGR